jgi:spermidine synthase
MKALAEKVVLMCLSSADPVRVLLIGLGGGAISSYLQDRCPAGRLTLENVEKDGRVAKLASQFFGFHADDERNTVDVADGLSAVHKRSAGAGTYDAVLVDCFAGQDRVPIGCRSGEFFQAAHALLKAEASGGGALLQNIWGRSSASQEVGADFNATVAANAAAFGRPPRREVVFDAPQSLEYILAGIRGEKWGDLIAPE